MLKLRELERRDIPEINRWRNDRELSSNLGGVFRFINLDVDNGWYDHYLASRSTQVRCAIVGDEDAILGCVYLLNIDQINQSADLHIMIGRAEHRGMGIGTFAVNAMVRHAFFDLNLRRLQLDVLASNQHAQALYRKIGFVEEGRRRSAVYKNGKYEDELVMGLLREEYQEAK
ncbi:MAG: GNAT family N-acetyltransferase [Clostridia bacterium]|nr:GNAT family N-acetyltransferase [Clostridia bacterium]